MKKRIITGLLVSTFTAAIMAGCGNTNTVSESPSSYGESAASTATAETASEKLELADSYLIEHLDEYIGDESMEGKKIGMTVQSLGNDFMVMLTDMMKEQVEAAGATIQFDTCDGDSSVQVEQIENYTTMGMDLIIAFPLNGEALVTAMDEANAKGIPTMAFAMEIPTDTITVTQKSAEEVEMGETCAQMASEWIDATFPDAEDGEIEVLLIGSTDSPEAAERASGMESLAQMNNKVSLKRQDTADWNRTDVGRNTTENEFLVNPNYKVILAINATTALGADSYLMSSDSPIEDYDEIAVFTVDETDEVDAKILSSANNESTLRGTVSLGKISNTVDTFMAAITPVLTKGTIVNRVIGAAQSITAESLS